MEKIFFYDGNWQKPAITEQHAFECIKSSKQKLPGYTYIAFPWASLFDGLARKTIIGDTLLKELRKISKQITYKEKNKIISTCQHIKFKNFYHLFKEVGITDLFVSHKEIDQTNLGSINLHPFQLFPVQAVSTQENEGPRKSWHDRDILFSFVGAYDNRYYLTSSRQYIFDHLKNKGGIVTERTGWHYENQVYNEQIYGGKSSQDVKDQESKKAEEYVEILKNSKFSLCPSGTGPNSIRLWESIELGTIPIILADTLDLPGDKKIWEKSCLFIKENENDIKSIPQILNNLIENKEKINDMLHNLKLLKINLGYENFTKNIYEKLNPNKKSRKIFINCNNLDYSNIVNWIDFLLEIKTAYFLDFNIFLSNHKGKAIYPEKECTPLKEDFSVDFGENFAFIFDSKTLTGKLLSAVDSLYIIANGDPKKTNHLINPISNIGNECKKLSWRPICTLITSMFNGDQYKKDFLENLSHFENVNDIEILIIRPESSGNEHSDLIKFGEQYSSTVYLWLTKDPGLYDVWNFATRIGSSKYCSNANIDDKRAPSHVQSLTQALEKNILADVASAALRVTDHKNQTWNESKNEVIWYKSNSPKVYGIESLFKYNTETKKIFAHNIPHCMPVWRAKLHRENGYFNERNFGPSSDWEFWLRCGISGRKFYLLNEDLGLYYRAPQSYWRRDPNAKNYDEIIANEYFAEEKIRQEPLRTSLRSVQHSNIINNFKADDYWAGFSGLYDILKNSSLESHTENILIKKICNYFLKIDLEILQDAEKILRPIRNMGETLYNFIGFYLRGLDSTQLSEKLLHQLICLSDKIISTENETIGWIIKAKLYQLAKIDTLETACLIASYNINPYEFWCQISIIYGTEKYLSYFLGKIPKSPPISNFEWLDNDATLHFLPDYSKGNPYQSLLYECITREGININGLNEKESIALDISKFRRGDTLHIHWINVLFKEKSDEELKLALDLFIEKLISLKSLGVKIIWSVHNRLNHDSSNYEIEKKFRHDLSATCDIVLLHHPMIQWEIKDWLSNNAKIQIIEHGNYEKIYENKTTKANAREILGLESKDLIFSTLGQIRSYKDLPSKITTFRSVFSDYSRAKYMLAGKISCQETLDTLKTPDEKILVKNSFIKNEDLQTYANASDYIILSYKDILTSGSFFQAATFNKSVISPNKGSLKYYVVNGVNGYKYDSNEDLETILSFIKENKTEIAPIFAETKWPEKKS